MTAKKSTVIGPLSESTYQLRSDGQVHPYTYVTRYEERSMSGTNTPGFYRLKKSNALLPINHYSKIERKLLSHQGGYGYFYPSPPYAYSSHVGFGPPTNICGFPMFPSESTVSKVTSGINYSLLGQMALASLNAEFDVLTFVAEAKEIPGIFSGAIRKFLTTVARKPRATISRKDLSGVWLEYNFAVQPLITDLQQIAELIAGSTAPQNGSSMASTSFSTTETEVINYRDSVYIGRYELVTTASVKARAYCRSKIKKQTITIDPFITGWELVKLSWLVDYVLSIGNAIEAFAALRHHPDVVMGGAYVIELNSTGRFVLTGFTNSDVTGYFNTNVSSRTVLTQRVPLVPNFIPQFKLGNLSVRQALNAFAYGIQRFT